MGDEQLVIETPCFIQVITDDDPCSTAYQSNIEVVFTYQIIGQQLVQEYPGGPSVLRDEVRCVSIERREKIS